MTDSFLKNPIFRSLNEIANARVGDTAQIIGKGLPCTVVEVVSSGIVKVNFDVNPNPWTLPQVIMPVLGSQYMRFPITPGDKGIAVPFDTFLGGQSGLGGGNPLVGVQPANLSALAFHWLGNANWSPPDDSQAIVQYGPNGVISRDIESGSVLNVTPGSIHSDTPVHSTTGNLKTLAGATGTFATTSGLTITTQEGVITNMMGPAGGGLINLAYFENIIKQVQNIGNQLSYFTNGGFTNALLSDVGSVISTGGADLEQNLLALLSTNSSIGQTTLTQVSNLFLNGAVPTSAQVTAVLVANAIQYPQSVLDEVQKQLLDQLQAVANEVMTSITGQINSITAQATTLAAVVPLATVPVTDLTSAISFITSFQAAVLAKQILPYANMLSQITQMTSQLTSINSAIKTSAQQLGGQVVVPTKPGVVEGQSVSVNMQVTRA